MEVAPSSTNMGHAPTHQNANPAQTSPFGNRGPRATSTRNDKRNTTTNSAQMYVTRAHRVLGLPALMDTI